MREWMIRRADQTFSRPVSDQEMVGQIEAGLVKPGDEICPSSGYWFSINEVEEVKRHFGDIHLHAMIPRSSEITSTTNTASVTEIESEITLPKIRLRKKKLELASAQTAVVNPLATAPSEVVQSALERNELQAKRARNVGILLSFIFFGILGLLWLGSR